MHTIMSELGVALLFGLFFSWPPFLAVTGQRLARTLRRDWRSTRYLSYGLVLLLISAAFTSAYYLNHPQPETYPDTQTYLLVTHHIQTQGKFTDVLRTPGYPVFITLVFLVAGESNIAAVSVGQAVLFVLAALELYILTILLFRRAWIALVVGLLVGTNAFLLSFAKPMLSEGMGLWLVASLALLVVLLVQRWQLRYLWLVALCAFVLFMTRPEWAYLPIPLFAYLLFLAWRRGKLRRFLPHGLVALVLLYALLGLYSYANGVQNGYTGITDNQRGNLLGKILQYHMQNEAPPQYAQVAAIVNAYVAQGGKDPNEVGRIYPPLRANNWALAGDYSQAIVAHHPLEFLLDTIPVFFHSSNTNYYLRSRVSNHGPFAAPLLGLQGVYAYVYESNLLFPLFALFWIILLCWRRTSRLPVVEAMGAVVLVTLYGLILTSLGGYGDYTRLHIPFDPMYLVVGVGTSLASLAFLKPRVERWRWQWRTVGLIAGAFLLGAVAVSMANSLLSNGLKGALDPHTWLLEHLVIRHPAVALVGVALAGFLVWLAYRAATRSGPAEQAAGSAVPPGLLDGDQGMTSASGTGFPDGEMQEAPPASRPT